MNPIIEEKVRVQRMLSKEAGSVSEYLRLAEKQAREAEGRFGIKWIRAKGFNPPEKIAVGGAEELKK